MGRTPELGGLAASALDSAACVLQGGMKGKSALDSAIHALQGGMKSRFF